MTSVGTFEAKTHLTHLLERVAKGERIIITNRGKPVAMLVPLEADNERDTAQIGLARFAEALGFGGIHDLISQSTIIGRVELWVDVARHLGTGRE